MHQDIQGFKPSEDKNNTQRRTEGLLIGTSLAFGSINEGLVGTPTRYVILLQNSLQVLITEPLSLQAAQISPSVRHTTLPKTFKQDKSEAPRRSAVLLTFSIDVPLLSKRRSDANWPPFPIGSDVLSCSAHSSLCTRGLL